MTLASTSPVNYTAGLMTAARTLFCIAMTTLACTAWSRELVLTEIELTVLKSGRPLASATIASCADYLSHASTECKSPVRERTDANGRATLIVATGLVPPPHVPGMPARSSDPSQAFWFKVLAGTDSREFLWHGLGFGIPGQLRLVCDVALPSPGPRPHRGKVRLPSLNCNL